MLLPRTWNMPRATAPGPGHLVGVRELHDVAEPADHIHGGEDRVLGHRHRVRRDHVRHRDAELAGRVEIDGVEPDAHPLQQLDAAQALEGLTLHRRVDGEQHGVGAGRDRVVDVGRLGDVAALPVRRQRRDDRLWERPGGQAADDLHRSGRGTYDPWLRANID